jgi:hypothetical protein
VASLTEFVARTSNFGAARRTKDVAGLIGDVNLAVGQEHGRPGTAATARSFQNAPPKSCFHP